MWQKILTWILQFALAQVGASLDAETRAAADEYQRRRVELEKNESDAAIELGRIETQIAQLNTQRAQNDGEIALLEAEIKAQDAKIQSINDEKNNQLDNLHDLSDDDLLHRKL